MSLIFTAWIALASAALSPGPNLVAVASRALGAGRRAALTVALGLGLGAFLWSLLTAIGLGALFSAAPILLRALGIIGGAYLLWLGIKGWRSALTGKGSQIAPVETQGGWPDLCHGLTVTATNPKVALLWASLSTFVGPALTSPGHVLLFCSGSALIIFAIYGAYGLVFSAGSVRGVYARVQRAVEAVFGTLFALLGLSLIFRSS